MLGGFRHSSAAVVGASVVVVVVVVGVVRGSWLIATTPEMKIKIKQ